MRAQLKKQFNPGKEKSLNRDLVSSTELLPISALVFTKKKKPPLLCKKKLLFCYRIVALALSSYLEGNFTAFDAQTTSTCCHGVALLFHSLVDKLSRLNLNKLLDTIKQKIEFFESNDFSPSEKCFCEHLLPSSVLKLGQLYILATTKERDFERGGWRTNTQKLKKIVSLGSRFFGDLTKILQTSISNQVADDYSNYLADINHQLIINNVPIKLWGKYIQPEYIRVDRRNRKYVSCMYSMQITLAYLIQHQVKIAIVSDLKYRNGVFQSRYMQVLEGDGCNNFKPIELGNHNEINTNESVVVFAGCTHSDHFSLESFEFLINPWLYCFPSLVLACDTFYPQFPQVRDDPEFDNSPINPKEKILRRVVEKHNKIAGFSSHDPSVFCLTHIYVASIKQILHEKKRDFSCLFKSFIPQNKLDLSASFNSTRKRLVA